MMRTKWLWVAMFVVAFVMPRAASAGTIRGGLERAATGNGPWTVAESWTNGSTTVTLTLSGTGAIGADLAWFLQTFAALQLPGTVVSPMPSMLEELSPPPTPETSTMASHRTWNPAPSYCPTPVPSAPPIAPVPEPSGVVLAISGLAAAGYLVRRRRGRKVSGLTAQG